MHLVDLNEIQWQPESQGRQIKSVETGITLWSLPGPGSFALQAQTRHTWIVLKGQGRLYLGQRMVAVSGGIALSDLYDTVVTFQVPDGEELVVMDVIIEVPKSLRTTEDSPDTALPAIEEKAVLPTPEPETDSAPSDRSVAENLSPSPQAPEPVTPALIPEQTLDPTELTDPSPPTTHQDDDNEDAPLPWVARLRSH